MSGVHLSARGGGTLKGAWTIPVLSF
jgi:hypothetical protein